jgi:hypothetical protein
LTGDFGEVLYLDECSINAVNFRVEVEVAMADKGLRKFKFERRMGRIIMNPVVTAMDKIGVRSQLVSSWRPPTRSQVSREKCRSPVAPTTRASG